MVSYRRRDVFVLILIGAALLVSAVPILRVARRVRANIRGFNRRALAVQAVVVDHDEVDGRRFAILQYAPEDGDAVRVAGMGAGLVE